MSFKKDRTLYISKYKYTKCYDIIIGDIALAANSATSLFLFSANLVFAVSYLVHTVYYICTLSTMRTYRHCMY